MVLTLEYPLSNIISSLIKSQYVLLKKTKTKIHLLLSFYVCGCGVQAAGMSCTMCVPGVLRGQKKESDPLAPEFPQL